MCSKKPLRSGIDINVLRTCFALLPCLYKRDTIKRLTAIRLMSDVWSDVAQQLPTWKVSLVENRKIWVERKNKYELKDFCILNIATDHLRSGQVVEVTVARFFAVNSMLQCQAYLNSIVPRLERQGVTVLLTLRISTGTAVKALTPLWPMI